MMFELGYVRLHVAVDTTDTLPQHGGSMLRGAFGPALKQTVCINPSFTCKECFAASECLFYRFYEQQNSYHPYRFDVDLSPNTFTFSLYLYGEATTQLPYVLSALHRMFTKIGLWSDNRRYERFTIDIGDARVYEGKSFNMSGVMTMQFEPTAIKQPFILHLTTPLRMKRNGELLKSTPTLTQILYSIHLRYEELHGRGRSPLGYEPSYHQRYGRTGFLDIGRYSRRQEQKLMIGGVVGEIGYADVDERSCALLRLGELIGAGKQTSFGMGKILIEEGV